MNAPAGRILNGISPRRLGLEVFLFFLLLYLLTANGRIVNRDGEAVFQVASSIAERGAFDVPAESVFETSVGPRGTEGDSLSFATETAMRGKDGRLYAMYGLGQSLVSVPFYYAGKLLSLAAPDVSPYFATRFAVAMLNPLVSAFACAFLFGYARALGLPLRACLTAAIVYGTATMAWPYAKSYASEPLVGLLLVMAAFGLVRSGSAGRPALWAAMAGAALGFAVMVRLSTGILVPVFVGYFLATARERGEKETCPPHPLPSTLYPSLVAFVLPLATALALVGLYNYVRFGSPLVTGYQSVAWNRPLLDGLYGLLLSPGKGLFWYNPVLILSALAFVAFFRWRRREALFVAALGLVWVVFHAPYRFWEGGWSWGPRLMVPILPFLLLPVVAIMNFDEKIGNRRRNPSSEGPWRPRPGRPEPVAPTPSLVVGEARRGLPPDDKGRLPLRVNLAIPPSTVEVLITRIGGRLLPLAIALGLAVQILGVGVDYTRYLWASYTSSPEDHYSRVIHELSGSPVVGQWRELAAAISNAGRPGELASARAGIAEKEGRWRASGLPARELSVAVLEETQVAGLNFPDFWFVYLYLFGASPILVILAIVPILAGTAGMLVVLDGRLRALKMEKGGAG